MPPLMLSLTLLLSLPLSSPPDSNTLSFVFSFDGRFSHRGRSRSRRCAVVPRCDWGNDHVRSLIDTPRLGENCTFLVDLGYLIGVLRVAVLEQMGGGSDARGVVCRSTRAASGVVHVQ